MLNGRTEHHNFDRRPITGKRHCDEIIISHVRLFRGAIGRDFDFKDDNASPHRSHGVEDLLESEDICRMDRPTSSPDLNVTAQVWDVFGRCLAARSHPPENTRQMKQI